MISAAEAIKAIDEHIRPLQTVTVALERALNAVLAEEIAADENIPPFNNAAMDGFAVLASDTIAAPVELRVTDEIAAGGRAAGLPIHPGETAAIMTGAKIPPGCDAVIQHELTERISDGMIKISRPVKPGMNIRTTGADIHAGQTVFEQGRFLRPQELGVLASLGKQFVRVYRTPRAAVLATGNELVPIDHKPGQGMIRNSNSYALRAFVREAGAEEIDLGIARDERDELRSKLREGLRADMLITVGGVSAGKYDLVIDELKTLGAEIVFWKVNIKPGMPLVFAMHGSIPIFGLPGNPVSSSVTFLQFVRPALYRMMGRTGIEPLRLRAALQESYTKNDGKRHFVRGILDMNNGTLSVRTTGSQVSNIMTSLARANCLIIIPEETSLIREGEEVEVELLR